MNESQPGAPHAEPRSVKKTIHVAAPREIAFQVFTAKMSTWWPLGTHHIGKEAATEVVVEPRAGGRWFERGASGAECEWGRVLAWEPPGRIVLAWQISAAWQPDAALLTEVEVRFVAEGPDATRVELEHRNLDRYGEKADEMTEVFGSEGGWTGLLGAFAAAASGSPPIRSAL